MGLYCSKGHSQYHAEEVLVCPGPGGAPGDTRNGMRPNAAPLHFSMEETGFPLDYSPNTIPGKKNF